MKKFGLSVLFFSILFCVTLQADESRNLTRDENLLEKNNISKLVQLNHEKIKDIKSDYQKFLSYLNNLDDSQMSSAAIALDYVRTCMPADGVLRDSVFVHFQNKINTIANALSESIGTDYPKACEQLMTKKNTTELKVFRDNIKLCGMKINISEGSFYFEPEYGFLYEGFSDRVSDGVKEYLFILKDEGMHKFAEDAALLIGFGDVYKRARMWEEFLHKYPDNIYKSEAREYFNSYMITLLTGLDNTRAFNTANGILLPKVKALYKKIIKNESEKLKSTQIIASYYKLLSEQGFKENEKTDAFLKANGLLAE